MNRIDIDRLIAARFAYEEAYNAAIGGTHERIEETSIFLPSAVCMRELSEAVGILPEGILEDESGKPMMRRIVYGGCGFYCHATDPVPGDA